jgi:threonyl-tRNA synthetase
VLDVGRETLARRVAVAHEQAIPHVVVVGAREVERRSLSVRHGEEQRSAPLAEAASELTRACAPPA